MNAPAITIAGNENTITPLTPYAGRAVASAHPMTFTWESGPSMMYTFQIYAGADFDDDTPVRVYENIFDTSFTLPANELPNGSYTWSVISDVGGGYRITAPRTMHLGPCGDADFNGDGDVGTDQDVEAFFACIGGNCCATCHNGGSDFNGDGDVGTDQDIESFFRVLGGGSC